ncbi:MAG: Asp-tRNA(Asn)/Glu-tRNA(Gln) amidotransferase subunit GatC [Mycoplasma sp.]
MKDVSNKFKVLAESLKFDLDNTEIEKIVNEYSEIVEKFNLIKNIDTSNVEPTNFIHKLDLQKNWREDVPSKYNRDEVFANATLDENSYVVIKNEK